MTDKASPALAAEKAVTHSAGQGEASQYAVAPNPDFVIAPDGNSLHVGRSRSAFIVRACNERAELLEALKAAISELDPLLRPDPHHGEWSKAYTLARAALLLAGKE